MLVVALFMGTWVGGAIGLAVGTLVPPNRISIMFAVILTPLMFTGAVQYPRMSLESLRWFQVVTAFNPLTYLSEAVRAAVVPDVAHIAPWLCLVGLVVGGTIFTVIG